MHIHFIAEGENEFKSLLYIPPTPPGNQFDPQETRSSGIKLYVRRVFITGILSVNEFTIILTDEQYQTCR